MATYRNSFNNYYSDKTGNHAPVGTILPVFADVNLAANDPEYAYPQHLYCDGKELLIRDYPELYSIIENRYGGGESVAKTQFNQPGGLRRSYVINNKLYFQFYYDSTNDKANVKRPYPYGSVFRFSTATGAFGVFSVVGIFNQSTFYGLELPTEDVTAQAQTNEFAYELTLPDSIDPTTFFPVNGSDYIKDFTGSDAHPLIIIQKSFSLRDYPYNIGTFNLPDYRQRKILGFGNVNGAGTSTPENAVNNFVGQTGGSWYIPKSTLIDSGEFFIIGDVRTTGYTEITADIAAYITGTVKYQIGPMDDYVFPFPPTHGHRILSVEVDQTKQAEQGPTEIDKFAVNYIDSRANINIFEPQGTAGGALGHSHGLIGVPLQNSQAATYGNSNGIGDRAGTSGDQQYQYLVSESASVVITSITYDSNTNYITINTDGSHNLSVGDIVTVEGTNESFYNGNFTVIADAFSNASLNVLPRDGETPTSSPATGNGRIKLANGYFVETPTTAPPRAYVVDNNTLVGGKQVVYEIPGNAITIKEETFITPQASVVTAPAASEGDVTGTYIQVQAPGGGGADSDTDGANAGYCEIGLTVDNVFYTIRVNGGSGGTAGAGGGAGGAGGSVEVPQALLDDTRFQISVTNGDAGDDGGVTGNGSNDPAGGGVGGFIQAGDYTTGGNGTAQIKEQTNNQSQVTYTSNGSWSIPTVPGNEVSRTITVELSGGGGGPGNANANSNCTGQWPGWPQSTSGKTGALGGYGGRGSRLVGTLTYGAGTLSWELGEGGNHGWNERAGNTVQGTTGNDPATGQPWQNFPGGIGTGYEPDGGSASVTGASGCISGAGGQGAWGNGATAGSGGGVTGVFLDGVCIAGAGGGGGGGGSGGGYNGGGTTDGCYPGGNAQGPAQSLIATAGVLDFANGGSGSQGGCSAGGGGGGGSACGIINVTPGGVGGQAGVGHNGNGGGTGGREGISAYRTTYWGGGNVSADSNGSLPTEKGYVKIQYSNVTTYYDNVGGGGGQGATITITFTQVSTPVTVNLQSAGQGGGDGTNGAGGRIYVRYFGQEQGTTVPGDTTDPTGKYYECDSAGNPTGAALDGDVWLSSTDPNIKQRGFGPGTGSAGGFAGGQLIPNNAANKITQYIEFTGGAVDSLGKRQLEVGQFNLSGAVAVRFHVIRGSGQNGGENPDQALNVFYKKGSSNNTTLFSQILLAANNVPGWQAVDIPIAEGDSMRDNNITLILEQDRGPIYQTASTTDDNYGLGAITFFYAPETQNTFISTGGATLQGNLDSGGNPINSDDGIDQVRREVSAVGAALIVSDGEFTMSSSTPVTTTAAVSAENDIPLITKYHRVKYLIKAL